MLLFLPTKAPWGAQPLPDHQTPQNASPLIFSIRESKESWNLSSLSFLLFRKHGSYTTMPANHKDWGRWLKQVEVRAGDPAPSLPRGWGRGDGAGGRGAALVPCPYRERCWGTGVCISTQSALRAPSGGRIGPHFLGLLFGQASLRGEAGAARGCLQGAAETCGWLVLRVRGTPKSHVQRLPSVVPFPHGCFFLFSKT